MRVPPSCQQATREVDTVEKIAILVLANAQVESLRKFASLADPEMFTFYVHLDARQDLGTYLRGEPMPSHVRFIDDRFPIFWGGFNMVRATEALAKEAMKKPNHMAFALISDDSFPLRSGKGLYDAISSRPIRIDTWVTSNGSSQEKLARYTHFYDLDSPHASARYLPVESRFVRIEDFEKYERMRRLMERGKYPLEIYMGSQWWVLPREILERCLKELTENAHLRESFEFSAIPDEMVFQTLARKFMPSDIGKTVTGMVYDFSRNPKPWVYSSLEEITPDLAYGRLFIRKVSPDPEFLNALVERNNEN